MSRVIARLLVIGVLATTVLAAVSSSADPEPGQPKAGSCHELTMRQANAAFASTASVDCDKRHTTRTLIVKRLKGDVDWTEPMWKGIYQSCARKVVRVLGGDRVRAMSAYELTFFGPTARDRARGAKWKRCDLTLIGGKSLRPLPEKLRVSSPVPDRFARCLAGPDRGLLLTVCSKKHTYRVTGAFRAPGTKYPGVKRLHRLAVRRCPDLVTSDVWRYDMPDRTEQWRGGWRTVICYSKTKK